MKKTGIILITIVVLTACNNCPKPEVSFGYIIDERDSNYYNTVTLYEPIEKGGEPIETTWFLENLRYQKSNNFRPTFCRGQYGCIYGYLEEYPDSICPNGWHIPTEDDWTIFFKQIKLYPTDSVYKEGKEPNIVYEDSNALKHPVSYLFSHKCLFLGGWIGGSKGMLFYVKGLGDSPDVRSYIIFLARKISLEDAQKHELPAGGYCRCVKNK